MAKVTVGDIVLFDQGAAQFPGIVTLVGDQGKIKLSVFTPLGTSQCVADYSDTRKANTYMLKPKKAKDD